MKKENVKTIFALFAKIGLNETKTLLYFQNKMLFLLDKKHQAKKYIKRIFEVLENYAQNVINTNIKSTEIFEDIESIIIRYNRITLY